jgi:hypothetical protein
MKGRRREPQRCELERGETKGLLNAKPSGYPGVAPSCSSKLGSKFRSRPGLKLRAQWPRLCDKVDCQHTDLLAARSCFQQCPFGRMPLPALPNLSSITLLTDFVVGHTLPSRPAHAPSLVSASWPMRPLLCNFRTTSSASLA